MNMTGVMLPTITLFLPSQCTVHCNCGRWPHVTLRCSNFLTHHKKYGADVDYSKLDHPGVFMAKLPPISPIKLRQSAQLARVLRALLSDLISAESIHHMNRYRRCDMCQTIHIVTDQRRVTTGSWNHANMWLLISQQALQLKRHVHAY